METSLDYKNVSNTYISIIEIIPLYPSFKLYVIY
jgi:hypothetical protein